MLLNLLGVASIVSGARAVLLALRDGYAVSGAIELSIRSLVGNYLEGLCYVLAVGSALLLLSRRVSSHLVRALIALMAIALAYLFVAARLPSLPFHAPGFGSNQAWAAQVGAIFVSLFATMAVFSDPGRLARVRGVVGSAAILVIVAAFGARLITASEGARWPERPNVILISLDTLRADRVSSYGYPRDTTPELDRFAESAVLFRSAYAPGSWTLTSHMSMFTSLYPTDHGVDEDRALSHRVPTLAELFREAGYETAALLDDVVWLSEEFGFDRGFATYRRIYGTAEDKNLRLEPMLDDLGDGPFFLFLHYFDVHSDRKDLPYESNDEDRELFAGWYDGDFSGCVEGIGCASTLLRAVNEERLHLDQEQVRWLADLYDAGVRSMDRELGLLLEGLEARGLLSNSVVIITADHGEELDDHGKFLHDTHFEECVHIPLIVRTPDTTASDRFELVSLVDIPATLLELCGLDSSMVQGHSFAVQVRGSDPPEPRQYVLFDAGGGLLGLRHGRWKLTGGLTRGRLFDLELDPQERNNLLETETPPGVLEELGGILEAERARMNEAGEERAAERLPSLDAEAKSLIKSLGYAGDS